MALRRAPPGAMSSRETPAYGYRERWSHRASIALSTRSAAPGLSAAIAPDSDKIFVGASRAQYWQQLQSLRCEASNRLRASAFTSAIVECELGPLSSPS